MGRSPNVVIIQNYENTGFKTKNQILIYVAYLFSQELEWFLKLILTVKANYPF